MRVSHLQPKGVRLIAAATAIAFACGFAVVALVNSLSTPSAIKPVAQAPAEQATMPKSAQQIEIEPTYFVEAPPGSTLPSADICAEQVRLTPETVPENTPYNQTSGAETAPVVNTYLSTNTAIDKNDYEQRVDGDFTGTTDEIIQWAACKWGFDEDTVRAQVYAESSWFAGRLGDCGQDTHERTGGSGGCASVGLLQVKSAEVDDSFHPGVFPAALESSALNLDYALAVHRLCFEGLERWLALEAPIPYEAGDHWNCMGRWFSGRYGDPGAIKYQAEVRTVLNDRSWESEWVGCPSWRDTFYCSNIDREVAD